MTLIVTDILIVVGVALIAVGVFGLAMRLVHGKPQDHKHRPAPPGA